jgi:dTDP-4-dehydrorhamnose reductase
LHMAGPEKISRYEFGLRLARQLKTPIKPLVKSTMGMVHSLAKRPADVSLDISLAKKLLRTPVLTIDDGLQQIFSKF